VQRQGCDHEVEGAFVEWGVLEIRFHDRDGGVRREHPSGDGRHGRIGLQREDRQAALGQGPGGLAGAAADLEDPRSAIDGRASDQRVDQLSGIAGAEPLVELGDLAEDEAL
jgi:hypothetical protein